MVPITSTNPASEHEKKQFDPNLVFIANFLEQSFDPSAGCVIFSMNMLLNQCKENCPITCEHSEN